MQTPKRIMPDVVRTALEETKFELVTAITLNLREKCGCPMGVVALAVSPHSFEGNQEFTSINTMSKLLGLSLYYVDGFLGAFDSARAVNTDPRSEGYDSMRVRAKSVSIYLNLNAWSDDDLRSLVEGSDDGMACRAAFIADGRGRP